LKHHFEQPGVEKGKLVDDDIAIAVLRLEDALDKLAQDGPTLLVRLTGAGVFNL
jgi:hypothetical protein